MHHDQPAYVTGTKYDYTDPNKSAYRQIKTHSRGAAFEAHGKACSDAQREITVLCEEGVHSITVTTIGKDMERQHHIVYPAGEVITSRIK